MSGSLSLLMKQTIESIRWDDICLLGVTYFEIYSSYSLKSTERATYRATN